MLGLVVLTAGCSATPAAGGGADVAYLALGLVFVGLATLATAIGLGRRMLRGLIRRGAPSDASQQGSGSPSESDIFRYSESKINAGNRVAAFAGMVAVVWVVTGAALMFSSLGAFGFMCFAAPKSSGIFEKLMYIGMIGGIAAPVILLAVVGIGVGSVFGGQSLSKYGFVVSVPFAIWFWAGILLCNVGHAGDATENLLSRIGTDVSLPHWPAQVYWVVMAMLVFGWFALLSEARSTVKVKSEDHSPEPDAAGEQHIG